jgi:hypothetical protein
VAQGRLTGGSSRALDLGEPVPPTPYSAAQAMCVRSYRAVNSRSRSADWAELSANALSCSNMRS